MAIHGPSKPAGMPLTMVVVTRVLPLLCSGGIVSLAYNAYVNPISPADLAALEERRDPGGRKKQLGERLARENERLIAIEKAEREQGASPPARTWTGVEIGSNAVPPGQPREGLSED